MKKLLILVMVLAMASLANATLSLSISGSAGSETISLVATGETVASIEGISVSGDDATIGTFAIGPKAGTMTGFGAMGTDAGLPNGEVWGFGIGIPPEVFQDGVWLTAQMTRTAVATATLTYYDSDGNITGHTDYIVPEPVTIALLGLGGLLLRRRMA
jgi:hypothetical protein